ncbi:3'-5' exoribonuclease (plasmid) [Chromobacterium amazonense]|uniref:3'-5' exoribonuclease n=1 Tax=Chromobacterium amazonense TaxID=1382803 RepID=UPI00237E67AA|nr:3'-5' exoribonuclease [Chromobacterium amazonense]MDE1712006.1 3'-5' exoribonuclease [Chromobacterium amazonense]
MLIFLDTEYTNMTERDLVSLAMVSEDGKQEIYIEIEDFPQERCSSFVERSVLPYLGQQPVHSVKLSELSQVLALWFAELPRSVFIGCDSIYDWEILIDILQNQRPVNLKGRVDLRPLIDSAEFHRAVENYHCDTKPWHHALHDARAHRTGWLAWMVSRSGKSHALPKYDFTDQ